MKKLALGLIHTMFAIILYGQTGHIIEPKRVDEVDNRVYSGGEGIRPLFKGGYAAWLQFLHCCLDTSVLSKDGVSGKKFSVTVRFDVYKDGTISEIRTLDIPPECPDCGVEAKKLFYKHNESNNLNTCNPKIYKEPYRQWLPAVHDRSVRMQEVSSGIQIIIPFGYYDEPQNKDIFDEAQRYRDMYDEQEKTGTKEKIIGSNIENQDNNNETDDELQTAHVVEQDNKYILTLLKDSSKHIVFRPLPKNMDTAVVNKINIAIGINQGGWGEITKDKNGKQVVTFYSFIGAGSNEINVAPVPIDFFKNMFYAPK